MADFIVRSVHNILKEYDDYYHLIEFNESRLFVTSKNVFRRSSKQIDLKSYIPKESSLLRTKSVVKDLVLCNDFELFCTFTFNPQRVDSFNLSLVWRVLSNWLKSQKKESKKIGLDFKYLVIPEKHKSGRFHFHGLLSGYSGVLRDSGKISSTGRIIYNISSYRSGFTTAVQIDSKEAVSNYITKYITKDFITDFNQRRFFASRNLARPSKCINSTKMNDVLPIFKKVIRSDDFCVESIIDKHFLI